MLPETLGLFLYRLIVQRIDDFQWLLNRLWEYSTPRLLTHLLNKLVCVLTTFETVEDGRSNEVKVYWLDLAAFHNSHFFGLPIIFSTFASSCSA
jgi:hypothetical protein